MSIALDLVDAETLRAKLDGFISPRLTPLNVEWRGDNRWVQPGDVAIRRVVHATQLKGLDLVFWWGLSFAFILRVSGDRLVYHRTFKSAALDLFEWPFSYAQSFAVPTFFERVFLFGPDFERRLVSYFESEFTAMSEWFAATSTLSGIKSEIRRQIDSPHFSYRVHHPSPRYLLPFVLAAQGKLAEAEQVSGEGFSCVLEPF